MPNITLLRKTIGRYLGQVLTPEIATEIELSAYGGINATYDPDQFGEIEKDGFFFRVERMADILPELHLLHLEHWLETEKHRHGLKMNPDYTAMLADERNGRMLQFTVRKAGVLVGNLRMYVLMSRHSQTLLAREDTLFLTQSARGGFTALTLMRFAEKALLSIGVQEIECDSKLVNNADVLMRRMKYTPVGLKFVKIFKGDFNEENT